MKRLFTILMMAILAVAVVSCDKDPEVDPGTENPPVVTYRVGDVYNDGVHRGVVFEVSEDGLTGKIVAFVDAEKKLLWNEAKAWCKELGEGWRLPSVDEATVLYNALSVVNNTLASTTDASPLLLDWYWTADKATNNEVVWTFNMETGESAYWDMYNGYENTRAIRNFGVRNEEPAPESFSITGQWEMVDIVNTETIKGVTLKEGMDIGYTQADALTEYYEVTESSNSSYKVGDRYNKATLYDADEEMTDAVANYKLVYENGELIALEIAVGDQTQTLSIKVVDNDNILLMDMLPLRRVESKSLLRLNFINMESEARKICVENWDTNDDGWFDIDEAAAVTDLGTAFFESKIEGFHELKYFTSITSIAKSAFMYSTIREITIPDNVTEIKSEAFKYCESLNSITIPEGVTSIGSTAFLGCEAMKTFHCLPTIPPTLGADALFVVSDDPFKILVPVESYELYIEARDWKEYKDRIYNANNRQIITFADSEVKRACVAAWDTDKDSELSYEEAAAVRYLADAFRNNTQIKEFEELQYFTGLESIGGSAFESCTSLKKVVLPEHIPAIDELAFYNCFALESIIIHPNVKTIGKDAFSKCTLLNNVQIRTGVESIGDYAFAYCDALQNISIPNSVTSIGKYAFTACRNLRSVSLSSKAKNIAEGTFYKCTSIKYMTIPEGIESIGNEAFSGCSSLTNITMPTSLSSLGDYSFLGCEAMTNVTIPENVKYMGDYLFMQCSSLAEVICEPLTPPMGSEGMFYGTAQDLKIYVYDPSLVVYKEDYFWRDYAWNIVGYSSLNKDPNAITFADNEVRDICLLNWDTNKNGHLSKGEAAAVKSLGTVFSQRKITTFNELKYFTGLSTIDNTAFILCSSLAEITLPENLTAIGEQAFQGCSSLKSLAIPESVSTIGEAAFLKCTNLATINIPSKVTTLQYGLFDYCSSLQSVTIPVGVTSIGDRVFSNCESLKDVTIPATVTSIGDSAFANCNSFTNVRIPNSVKTLGAYVCFNCAKLSRVFIGTGVTSLDYAAFFRCPMLLDVYCKPTTPPAGAANIFSENAVGRKIHVPTASVATYKKADYWSDYSTSIVGYDFE